MPEYAYLTMLRLIRTVVSRGTVDPPRGQLYPPPPPPRILSVEYVPSEIPPVTGAWVIRVYGVLRMSSLRRGYETALHPTSPDGLFAFYGAGGFVSVEVEADGEVYVFTYGEGEEMAYAGRGLFEA